MHPRPCSIGLLTSRELRGGIPDDQPLVEALRAAGYEAEFVVWDDPCGDWAAFDALLVRTVWDYYLRVDEFLAFVDRVEEAGVPLWNPPPILRWNHDKRYLRDLARAGVPVAPTRWLERGEDAELASIMASEEWEEAVVKPAVSAGAHETWRVRAGDASKRQPDLHRLAARSAVLVQPFLREVVEDGEWSFLFFGGEFSHAVLKRPAVGDFRVQPQYGGVTTLEAPSSGAVAQAAAVVAAAPGDLLYARVDGTFLDGVFHLVELEAIEPRLFLTLAPGSGGRLAAELGARL